MTAEPRSVDVLDFGSFALRLDDEQLLVGGRPAPVGARAFAILRLLVERRGRLVTKDELFRAVWPGRVVEENNLSVQMSALRRLLGRDVIATVAGRGYRFDGEPRLPSQQQDDDAPALVRRVGNLPPVVPPLYGREADARRVIELFEQSPLVTLYGAGGIGKTSLAAVVAQRLAPGFAHGTWLVELAAVQDPALVASTVAQCLALKLPGHACAHEELARALDHRELLLVLDNCEHVVGAVATLAHALMTLAPGVRLLATSQELLRVPAEHVHRLEPLAVPPAGQLTRAEDYGAVRLFVERVRSHLGRFELDAGQAADVVEICRRLDGIALAIELAAARVPLLGVAGVRSRLDERLGLLVVGPRTASGRHATLRAALAWSHQLLQPESQVVLRRLGVFTGGFSLDGAQRVIADDDAAAAASAGDDALLHLSILADRSMLTIEPGPRPRYRLLESMREFALERLAEAGETDAWRRRHAHATRDICRLAVQQRDSAWLWSEMSNARVALNWAGTAPGEGAVAVAIATHTAVVLATAGPVPEAMNNLLGVQHLLGDDTPPAVAARYWQWLGRLGVEGRMPTSRCIEALQRAAAMFEQQSNWRHVHACRRMIAEAYMRTGDLATAERALQAAVAVEFGDGPPADRMRRLRIAGLLADASGNHDDAMRLVQSALEIAEAHRIERYCLMLVTDLAWVQLRMGDPDAAAARLQALLQRIEPTPREGLTQAYALAGLTAALVAAGRLAEARAGAVRTVHALRGSGIFLTRGDIFAWLAAASGHPQVAARLIGATDAFHARVETRRDRLSQHARDAAERLVAEALPPAEAAFWAGQGQHAEEAVLAHLLERAFGGDEAGAPRAGPSGRASGRPSDRLADRSDNPPDDCSDDRSDDPPDDSSNDFPAPSP